MKNVAIVLAAGQGKRMNTTVSKQYLLLDEKPILYYSLMAFEQSFIDEIILVVGKEEISFCQTEIVEKYKFKKVQKIVVGGAERYHSVFQGLLHAGVCDYIYIHDGARPFLDEAMLERAKENVMLYDACVLGVPSKDTIKIVDQLGFAENTPNRDLVWQIQTPQIFSYLLIMNAYRLMMEQEQKLIEKGIKITDDAMVIETFTDHKVKLILGSYKNIKITTTEDMEIAKIFMNSRL